MSAHILLLAEDERDVAEWKDEYPELADHVFPVTVDRSHLAAGRIITSYTYTARAAEHPDFYRVSGRLNRQVAILDRRKTAAEANRFVRSGADAGTL